MVSVAANGNTSWVCDPNLESYALEQPEMLRCPDYRHNCHVKFKCAPTVLLSVFVKLNGQCFYVLMGICLCLCT